MFPGGSQSKAVFCAPTPTLPHPIRWKLRMQILSADMPGIFLKITQIGKAVFEQRNRQGRER